MKHSDTAWTNYLAGYANVSTLCSVSWTSKWCIITILSTALQEIKSQVRIVILLLSHAALLERLEGLCKWKMKLTVNEKWAWTAKTNYKTRKKHSRIWGVKVQKQPFCFQLCVRNSILYSSTIRNRRWELCFCIYVPVYVYLHICNYLHLYTSTSSIGGCEFSIHPSDIVHQKRMYHNTASY